MVGSIGMGHAYIACRGWLCGVRSPSNKKIVTAQRLPSPGTYLLAAPSTRLRFWRWGSEPGSVVTP